ncbi:mannose-1-phosphate guanylyltransferase [Aestuariivirga sp.]|uniref:mannose-1-phosphate guanylyltransferase n=1 Tax=Aestuariivirga sp. TaxID=2650926 RepID=UPI0039E37B79
MNGDATAEKIIPVILCGGAGSRLWPASREAMPKQFLPLFDGRSLFDLTLQRIADPSLFADPVVVTADALAPHVLRSLGAAGMRGTVLLEPCRRNTAPAIALALEACATPDALMLVLASDHFIADGAAFRQAVRDCAGGAAGGHIITFGVTPDSPHSGYGYIEKGGPQADGLYAIARFIEKPAPDVALSLLGRGCLWNSGNFMFRACVMQEELAALQPAISTAVREAVAQMQVSELEGNKFFMPDEDAFARAPDLSIDYAVLEHSRRGACKPVSYRWSDMGTWNAVWEHRGKDSKGNAVTGPATLHLTEGALVISEAQHVAVVGMCDVAVIVTAESVLVAPRSVGKELTGLLDMLRSDPEKKRLT